MRGSYRGGTTIIGASGRQLCTWGFYGTRGSAAKYVLSAGHCAVVGEVLRHGSPTEVTFTAGVELNTFQMISSVQLSDSMVAHVLASSNAVAPFNTIWASGTDKAHTITGRRASSSQAVGDPVCFEGTVTGTSLCATIEAKGVSYSLERYDGEVLVLYNQLRMSRVGKIGDSGGPVLLYSSVDNVEADMATQICLTSSC